MDTKQNISQSAKKISLRFILAAVIFLCALALFGFIADEMVLENETGFDQRVFQALQAMTSAGMTRGMIAVTFFGSSYFLFPAYLLLILYFLFFKKNKRLSWNVGAVAITSTVILFSLKAIFHRHRPLDPLVQNVGGFSFPSGHSFSSFTFFGLLIYILWNQPMNTTLRWLATVLFFMAACAIAFSRVYLHVHYASDVIAGFCLCLVWLGLSFWVFRKIK